MYLSICTNQKRNRRLDADFGDTTHLIRYNRSWTKLSRPTVLGLWSVESVLFSNLAERAREIQSPLVFPVEEGASWRFGGRSPSALARRRPPALSPYILLP